MKDNNLSQPNKILVITLTNIGDAILSFPVIDALINGNPQAEISVMAAPKSKTLFENNASLNDVYIYDKKQPLAMKIKQFADLRKHKFDLVVDLKNSALSHFLGAKKVSPPETKRNKNLHMAKKHIERLRSVYNETLQFKPKHFFQMNDQDNSVVDQVLSELNNNNKKYVVIAPGSLNEHKRWPAEKFIELCRHINTVSDWPIILVGDSNDSVIGDEISQKANCPVYNVCGQTTLNQCAGIIARAQLAIVNDSGPMHMACYLDKPVVAIFGPSNVKQYGPWSDNSVFVKGTTPFHNENLNKDQTDYTDINSVDVKDVIDAFSIEGDRVIIHER